MSYHFISSFNLILCSRVVLTLRGFNCMGVFLLSHRHF
nr:MAG TPA: hypothetical protein [Caudoviricetes sp.]